MRVLLIKLSSMGDVIHTLPAITDAMHNIPNLEITWVIEPGFQEIAQWHPAVKEVIALPLRSGKVRDIWQAIKRIRAQHYDLVVDSQGLLKSAIFAKLAKAKIKAGLDWTSSREAIASLFYNRKCTVNFQQHAVVRARKLFSQVFRYQLDLSHLDYGLHWDQITQSNVAEKPYIVFLHGTTWESKHWPDEYWFALADIAASNGYAVQVTWATPEQKARATALAQRCSNVQMLPHLTIQQAATVLHHAQGVVAVDTGFAHLSAALDKPLVGIYGPTDIKQSGTVGNRNVNLASKFACAPCEQRICRYVGERSVNPPCFQEISPQLVWHNLMVLIKDPSSRPSRAEHGAVAGICHIES
ncbi:MAG TPA: lipopolysaccharide heptosyltransferase I [Gammaproteobacteria bacterium]|nr:lipopolysaccharide heptosyltransferase I [Gammaproteobacteria bacterium]